MKVKLVVPALFLSLSSFMACSPEPTQGPAEEKIPVTQVANPVTEGVASIAWAEQTYNFGQIPKDVPVRHRFEFTNTGSVDLVLENVKAQCGCTTTDYSKEPVKPGEKGFVEAEFNAKAVGIFKKSINIVANTEPKNIVLAFNGEVME